MSAAALGPYAGTVQVLTFVLGGEPFGIGVMQVKEIIQYGHVTPVPMMPAWVRGVVNLRGAVAPVVDLLVRFARPASPVTRRTCIVVVEVGSDGERRDVGLVVDAVSTVLDLAAADIEPPPTMGVSIDSGFIRGMGKVDGRFIVIIEPGRALSDAGPAAAGRSELQESP